MTAEDIMSFQGHEFIYVFRNGDTMPAYIKKIDLDKNIISYWSFSLVTNNGYKFAPLNEEEKTEGACCLGFAESLDEIFEIIKEIKTTGIILYKQRGLGDFEGCPF